MTNLNFFLTGRDHFSSVGLLAAGAVIMLLGAARAIRHEGIVKKIFFHAISQAGCVMIGLGTAGAMGKAAAAFHAFNIVIWLTCLSLIALNIRRAAGGLDPGKLGGLASRMPVTFVSFLIVAFSISGMPPLNGFFSIWIICQGLIQNLAGPGINLGKSLNVRAGFTAVLCLTGIIFTSALTLVSFINLLHSVFLGRPAQGAARTGIKEAPWFMWLAPLALSLSCIALGVFTRALPLKYFMPKGPEASVRGNYAAAAIAAFFASGIIAAVIIYRFSGAKDSDEIS